MNHTTSPLLEMRGITKRFPGVVALNNVSLEARPAEVVALVGENGAGKSTLMKILGGIHQPDAGEIRINGEVVTIHSVNDSMRLGIGFIHQELNVLPNLDVDRKSTRLNSSHLGISYAVFCLKKNRQ